MRELKKFDEALVLCNKAISLNPNFAEAISNKAAILVDLKQYDNAIINFNDALKIEFGLDWVYGDLIHTKMKICDWSESAEHLKKITSDHKVVRPFILLALNDDISLHKKISDLYTLYNYPLITNLGNILKRPQDQRIRVGYFSADFHNHATGNLIAELFELHDKSQFEIIAFSFGPVKNDEMSQRLKRSFDQFIQVGEMSDFAISKLSRDLNIDIGVDLKGFTQDARTGIFAYRAAPIQVNYLGYPGTMGAEYIDYIIADKILIPVEYQSYYSEKVVYLPNSYQVNDRKRSISDKKFTRSDLGLPETGFIFCNFNNNFKITPATFNSWMRILSAVEGSSLWLLQDNFWAVSNLKREAEKQGISAHRLIFAERLALNEHLARHCLADLFLDTFPYNAHTTASDALWTGLPIVTLMGKSFASRVAASLLNAVGLPELITTNENQYEALAIDLATRPNKLNEIRLKLANNRLTTPLFDTPLFAKNLEAAYIKMYKRYQANLEPDHIILNIDL